MNPIRLSNQPGLGEASGPSLRDLFDQEQGRLLRYAFYLVGRRASAEEIVQEAFLKLHDRWDEVDAPRAWLFRSVRNSALNHLRDNGRLAIAGEHADAQPDAADPPDELLARREAVGVVRLLVEELNEDDRRLVTLKYFENLKYREISERTGLSVGNVGYRLHHLLKGLARRLRQVGIDGLP